METNATVLSDEALATLKNGKTYIDDGTPVALLKGGTEFEISEFVRKVAKHCGKKLEWHKELTTAILLCYTTDSTEKGVIKRSLETLKPDYCGEISYLQSMQ